MVELVDTQDLKSCDLKSRAGSIPALSTQKQRKTDQNLIGFFVGYNIGATFFDHCLTLKYSCKFIMYWLE